MSKKKKKEQNIINVVFFKQTYEPFEEMATVVLEDGKTYEITRAEAREVINDLCFKYTVDHNMTTREELENADYGKILKELGVVQNLSEEEHDQFITDVIESKKVGFREKAINLIKKKFPEVKKFALSAATIVLTITVGGCSPAKSNDKAENNSDTSILTEAVNDVKEAVKDVKEEKPEEEVLDYSTMTFDELLEVTKNKTKKETMTIIGDFLRFNNIDFADFYAKEGVEDKFCLTFDEAMALYLRVNDFSEEELQSIFDTYEFDAEKFKAAYKTGNLQLMGELIAERRDMPLDLSPLFKTDEGKALFEKYNENMLALNEAIDNNDTDEIVRLDKEFYDMVMEDFPQITEVTKMEGTVHNFRIDDVETTILDIFVPAHLLVSKDANKDLWNDNIVSIFSKEGAICNHVKYQYENIEETTRTYRMVILASKQLDNYIESTDPKYEDFRDKLIDELLKKGALDEVNREWTSFVIIDSRDVNLDTEKGEYSVETTTSTKTKTWQEKTSKTVVTGTEETKEEVSRGEAVGEFGANAVEEQEKKIEEADNKYNEQQKAAAEAEAETEKNKLQEQENQHKAELDEEIKKENDKVEETINNIKPGDSISDIENETNGKVDIDDNFVDGNGNIKDNVEDITTNPNGAVSNNQMPDPNKTGAELDNNEPKLQSTETIQSEASVEKPIETPTEKPTETPVEKPPEQQNGLPNPGDTGAELDNNEPVYDSEETTRKIAENIVNDMAEHPENYLSESDTYLVDEDVNDEEDVVVFTYTY